MKKEMLKLAGEVYRSILDLALFTSTQEGHNIPPVNNLSETDMQYIGLMSVLSRLNPDIDPVASLSGALYDEEEQELLIKILKDVKKNEKISGKKS